MTIPDISNQALQLCGAETVILTMDDVNKETRLCRNTYDVARRAVLQRHPWKFSIVREVIDLDITEVPAFGYTGRYLLPESYIRMVQLNDTWDNDSWTREGRYVLYSSGQPINVRYVSDVTAIELFDPLFIDALIAELAARICYPITQSNERLETIYETAVKAIKTAKRADAIEQSMLTIQADTFDNSRITRLFDVPGR